MKSPHTRLPLAAALLVCGCGHTDTTYHNPNMDFAAVQTVAVLPFANLTRDTMASERVRDVVSTMLLATGAFYVLPAGEVARGVVRTGIGMPSAPTPEEVVRFGGIVSADAVITGAVKEYGEVRSAASTANAISLSLQMYETQTGKVIWSAATTRGGVGVFERLLGGGGRPMNDVTEGAVSELINALFE